MKRLGRIYAAGLTVEELTKILNKEYAEYVKNPSVKLTVIRYRPIKIYISGEVENPGYYVLQGNYSDFLNERETNAPQISGIFPNDLEDIKSSPDLIFNNFFPSLFYAIRKSGGVSINADLKNVEVTRKILFLMDLD